MAWTRGGYSFVASDGSVANGTLTSPGGSVLIFQDDFRNTSFGFEMQRTVTVAAAGDDYAFSSQFSLYSPDELMHVPRQLFIPGVAYQNASTLPAGALAGDPGAAHILIREDRLPLPFVAAVFANSGTAQLTHVRADGSTLPNEDFTARIVDERLQFASLGFLNYAGPPSPPQFLIAIQYPGSEGDRTYVWKPTDRWANRSHPLSLAFSHNYTVQFAWQPGSTSYHEAAKSAWRGAFASFAPSVPTFPAPSQVYRDGIELLAGYIKDYNGVPSVPFEARLPDGVVIDSSSQMGFVGRALPCAALLLYDAVVVAPNATRQLRAEAIVDLWVNRSMTDCGMLKTWYDITPQGGVTWRASSAYGGSTRITSDGVKGVLDAWSVLPAKASWLAYAVRYGDFLVSQQGADGSFFNSFDWACQPLSGDKRQTAFVIPFLTSLFAATNDTRYYDAAIRGGAFAAAYFSDNFVYSGGAVDNPDVPDKESGWLAAQAFIALFETTMDAAWLQPAAQAATYTETFTYAWNVPIPCDQNPATVYPCHRTTLGASLIATGQSSSDNYMAIASFDFKKLGMWLKDDHFSAFAQFIEAATTQVLNWDDSLGYAQRGLMNEATEISVRRGSGVSDWLPWLSANSIYPFWQQLHERASS